MCSLRQQQQQQRRTRASCLGRHPACCASDDLPPVQQAKVAAVVAHAHAASRWPAGRPCWLERAFFHSIAGRNDGSRFSLSLSLSSTSRLAVAFPLGKPRRGGTLGDAMLTEDEVRVRSVVRRGVLPMHMGRGHPQCCVGRGQMDKQAPALAAHYFPWQRQTLGTAAHEPVARKDPLLYSPPPSGPRSERKQKGGEARRGGGRGVAGLGFPTDEHQRSAAPAVARCSSSSSISGRPLCSSSPRLSTTRRGKSTLVVESR